jgi:hypothetical protein
MSNLKHDIQQLVAQARLEDALDRAKQAATGAMIALDTPVVLMQGELEYVKRSHINNLVDSSELMRQRQKIAARLLSLIDDTVAVTPAPAAVAAAPAQDVILFLGANPFQHLALELEREIAEISAGLERFGQRQGFDFRAKMHVNPADLQRMLLEPGLAPRFVHFAGNAVVEHPDYGTGVLFEDERGKPRTVGGDMLAAVLQQFPGIECVVLNTCDSGPTALAVGQKVPYAIGMNAAIYDTSAIEFGVAFYEAIAGGKDVPFAFRYARMRLELSAWPDQAKIPVLISNGVADGPVYVPNDDYIGERVVR